MEENRRGYSMFKDERTIVVLVALAVVFSICIMIFTLETMMIANHLDGQVAGIVVGAFIMIVSAVVTLVTVYAKFARNIGKGGK
jgi:uncharacterized membrane protein